MTFELDMALNTAQRNNNWAKTHFLPKGYDPVAYVEMIMDRERKLRKEMQDIFKKYYGTNNETP